jgi:hypothetical protein
MKYLPDEQMYLHLAEFLRAGGILEVGENLAHGSFARLRIRNTTVNIVKMAYLDFANVLKEMDFQARRHLEERENQ